MNFIKLLIAVVADVLSVKTELHCDPEEIEKGQVPIWVTLDEAIRLIQQDSSDDYQAQFIKVRDLMFLETAREVLAR